jgi:hypothetical protein
MTSVSSLLLHAVYETAQAWHDAGCRAQYGPHKKAPGRGGRGLEVVGAYPFPAPSTSVPVN